MDSKNRQRENKNPHAEWQLRDRLSPLQIRGSAWLIDKGERQEKKEKKETTLSGPADRKKFGGLTSLTMHTTYSVLGKVPYPH